MRTNYLWVLALAACGGGGGDVRVTVSQADGPLSGVEVFFLDADGAMVGTERTGANGVASHELEAGGSVTAVNPFSLAGGQLDNPPTGELFTITDVQPGDELLLTSPDGGAKPPGRTFTVTVPRADRASLYMVWSTCGDFLLAGGLTQTFTMSCASDAVDLLVTAQYSNQATLGSFTVPGVVISDGETIDLSTHTYDPPVTSNVTAAFTLPEDQMSFQRTLYFADGTIVQDPGFMIDTTASFQEPVLVGATVFTEVDVREGQTTRIVGATGLTLGDQTIDVDGQALPSFDSPATYDAASATVRWTPGAGPAVPTYIEASLSIADASGSYWVWNVFGPSTPGAVAFPVLADDGAQWNPTAASTVRASYLAEVVVPGGWDAARPTVVSNGANDLVPFPSQGLPAWTSIAYDLN